jgi:hypothetical protein
LLNCNAISGCRNLISISLKKAAEKQGGQNQGGFLQSFFQLQKVKTSRATVIADWKKDGREQPGAGSGYSPSFGLTQNSLDHKRRTARRNLTFPADVKLTQMK